MINKAFYIVLSADSDFLNWSGSANSPKEAAQDFMDCLGLWPSQVEEGEYKLYEVTEKRRAKWEKWGRKGAKASKAPNLAIDKLIPESAWAEAYQMRRYFIYLKDGRLYWEGRYKSARDAYLATRLNDPEKDAEILDIYEASDRDFNTAVREHRGQNFDDVIVPAIPKRLVPVSEWIGADRDE